MGELQSHFQESFNTRSSPRSLKSVGAVIIVLQRRFVQIKLTAAYILHINISYIFSKQLDEGS